MSGKWTEEEAREWYSSLSAGSSDIRRHRGNRCVHCVRWVPKQPDDMTAPEGTCTGLKKDPGHYPFGYWPNTLAADSCPKFKQRRPE